MANLREYNQKLALLEQLKQEVAEYENDPGFQADLKFRERLKALQEEYGKSDQEMLEILNPSVTQQRQLQSVSGGRGKGKRTVTLKLFRHPKTGEEIVAKNLLNKRLQEWIEENDRDTVKSWVVNEWQE